MAKPGNQVLQDFLCLFMPTTPGTKHFLISEKYCFIVNFTYYSVKV